MHTRIGRKLFMKHEFAVLNVSQMGEADRMTIASGTTEIELMERAGRAVSNEIVKRWSSRPVIVLCGPGNNGGDGFVVARILAQMGWPVRVALVDSREKLTGAARYHSDLWSGSVAPITPAVLNDAELVVDALFGAGLNRALEGSSVETLKVADYLKLPIVAIDVPSGVMDIR
jgi:ADP-dependent NAD(P)H-hydrate dehydratase / NAD(P)H-hydrate epimerase